MINSRVKLKMLLSREKRRGKKMIKLKLISAIFRNKIQGIRKFINLSRKRNLRYES